jgi:hypothetical protein
MLKCIYFQCLAVMKGENTICMTTNTPKGEEVRAYEFSESGLVMVSTVLHDLSLIYFQCFFLYMYLYYSCVFSFTLYDTSQFNSFIIIYKNNNKKICSFP